MQPPTNRKWMGWRAVDEFGLNDLTRATGVGFHYLTGTEHGLGNDQYR